MSFRSERVSVLRLRSIPLLKSVLFGSFTFLTFPYICFGQVLENMEIIWKATWPDYLTGWPDSCQVFGISVAGVGDVNGDGYDDVMIGSLPVFYLTATDTPTCYAIIYLGGKYMDTIPDLILKGEHPRDSFGNSVSSTGDFNHDGYDDVIVGAGLADEYYGKAYIYYGGSYLDSITDLVLRGRPTGGGNLGSSVAHAGDVNGDGYDDIVVGARGTNKIKGRVYIYFGGLGADGEADVLLEGGHGYHEGFGICVGGGGDVNGDGFDDILVGADAWGPSLFGEGRIYVYYGGNTMDTIADVWMDGEGPNQCLGWFGIDHTFGGNSDSYADVVTGTPLYPHGFFWPEGNSGKVYLLFGDDPMDGIPDVWMVGRTDKSSLGVWSSRSGKIKEDECDGVLSGAPYEPYEYWKYGTSYLWLGGDPIDTTPDAWMRGEGS